MRLAGEVMVLPRIFLRFFTLYPAFFFALFIRLTPHFFTFSPDKKFLKYFCIKYLTNALA